MAAAPAYAVTPLVGSALVNNGTADTSYSAAPTHGQTLLTAGVNGTKITEIDLIPAGTISSGGVVVTIWLYDGTNYHLHEPVLVPAVTPGTQVAPSKIPYYYDNLVVPNGWTLYVTETIAAQPVQVNAYGASL